MNQRESLHERYTESILQMRSLELDMTRFEQEETKLTRDLEHAKQRLEKQRPALHKNLAKKEVEVEQSQERLKAATEAVAELRNNLALGQKDTDTAHDIFQLATTMESQRAELIRIAERSADTKTILAEAHRQQQHFSLKAQEWFGTTKLNEGKHGDIDTLQHDVGQLEAQLEAGRVNDAETLAEYEEVSSRYEFLASQLQDLTTASEDLANIIGELDKVIHERFETAFEDISEHFSKYFKRLFGDGRAKLTLTKDETSNYGIDISAIPRGKRVENLNMLSGGERALTGIALLAAILAVNPSPFVVLDEVDAALDEANSGRFSEILAELAEKSQLIVITHNRQTMQSAHTLFGVTMDDNHASRLLSLRLEEAAAMAARD
jgi:chromosome segregation protein